MKHLKIFQKMSLTALLLGSFVLVGTGCGKKKNSDDIGEIIAQEYDDYAKRNQDKINQPIPTGTTQPTVIEEPEPTQEKATKDRDVNSDPVKDGSSRKSLLDIDRERNANVEYHSILEEDRERNRKAAEEKEQREANQFTPTPTVQNSQDGTSYIKK